MYDIFALVKSVHQQRNLYPGEEVTLDEIPDDLEGLTALKAAADSVAQAAKEVSRQASELIISKLGEGGMTKLGQTFYRAAPKRTIKIKREEHSRFWDWVRVHDMAPRLFNPNSARVGGLAAMRELPDPETGEIYEAKEWDRKFLDIETGDQLKLDEIPPSKQRKWQQRLPEGYVQRAQLDWTEEEGDNDDEPE